jgi:hypothetical protein
MECKKCLLTSDIVHIENGECEFCRLHDELEKQTPEQFERILKKIRKRKGYQVLIGISGGWDSSYLLWYTVEVLGLKPLVLHFNNRWNNPIAEYNMNLLVNTLDVDLLRITSDDTYDRICGALLLAGVKDADIANDMYMADIMQTTALKYNIKYIFNGHDFRTEGSTPLGWTYMDAKYMASVYEYAYGEKLKIDHLQTFAKQIWAGIRGIKHIRVFHYINIPQWQKDEVLKDIGIRDYGAKHGENIYTKFIGYWLLPKKWGIDKRIVYLSAQVRSGYLTKEEARLRMMEDVDLSDIDTDEILARTWVSVDMAMAVPKKTYKDFDHYNFKRFKPLIWLMAKLHLISYTFYKKYT